MIHALTQRLHARSAAMLLSMEARLDRIMLAWLSVAAAASAVRIDTSPMDLGNASLATIAPYVLLVLAPVISMLLALRWFAGGASLPQPATRLARVGRWRTISRAQARRHPLFGASGMMLSLLVGMLLNVPVRAVEYLAALPALSGAVPNWLSTLHALMTIDVVLLCSLYVIAFVAALRRVPHFPRLLAAIWVIDLTMQMMIAQIVVRAPDLPIAVAQDLRSLLEGNIAKVLVSVALWLPYLLLSQRVNVTYRQRIPA